MAYTDQVIDQIIDTLARDGRRAALVYAADHGETVPGGACEAGSANRTTRDAYEVPALVWLSNSYAQAHPAMAEGCARTKITRTPWRRFLKPCWI